ncbi:MAG: heme o synthase [Alphaproteobacteria bacterium]|nr:heme o synthase [Alphaproteobacteria bacterium]
MMDIAIATETRIADYIALLKPRVMSLVVFSGACGMMAAPGHIHPLLGLIALFALAVGAGAAGAINMWYDRDIDAVMNRTKNRPIPAGLVNPSEALGFGIALSIFAVILMALAAGPVAAGILAFANIFYSIVYTVWLKRSTPQNIVIGGAAGAFPPMIGWVAVTGHIDIAAIVLFMIIFIWTPPHFWALALFSSDDYKRAGIPMMPCVAGPEATKRQMLAYTIVLFPLAVAPYYLGVAGVGYAISAAFLGFLFIVAALRVMQEKEVSRAARQMFGYSIFYLFAIFTALVLF